MSAVWQPDWDDDRSVLAGCCKPTALLSARFSLASSVDERGLARCQRWATS